MNKKVILAFSGGLDTSYCAKYLSETLGYDVYAVTVNTGGFSKEEEKELEKKALNLGVKEYRCVDAQEDYYNSCVKVFDFRECIEKQYLSSFCKCGAYHSGTGNCKICD
jgi:argininosuccinate synthase